MLRRKAKVKKKEEEPLAEFIAKKLILGKDEASKLDADIKAYIAVNLTSGKNEEIRDIIIDRLKHTNRYREGVNDKTKEKCKEVSRKYLHNNEMWIFFEGIMCIVAYLISLVAMIDTIIRDFNALYDNKVNQDAVLAVTSCASIIIAYFVDKKGSSVKMKLKVDIFNRFSPTLIMVSTVLFYLSRVLGCTIMSIAVVLLFLGFLIFTMVCKYNSYKIYIREDN